MSRLICCLLSMIMLFSMLPQWVFGADAYSAKVYPVGDAGVTSQSGKEGENSGDKDVLPSTTTADVTAYVFMRFDLSEIKEPILSAKLSFAYRMVSSVAKVSVYSVKDNNWKEETLTWKNKPQFDEGKPIGTIDLDPTGSDYSDAKYIRTEPIDISKIVKAGEVVNLVIAKTNGGKTLAVQSREISDVRNRPYIEITTKNPVEIKVEQIDITKIYPTPAVTPNKGHPRLLVNDELIDELRTRAKQGDPTYKEVEEYSLAKATDAGSIKRKYEAQALMYLLYQDKEIGRASIEATLKNIKAYELVGDIGTESRTAGDLIFGAALVYDWCYDLLPESEKKEFIENFIRISSQMETGWPPVKMKSVTSHAAETIFLRDLIGVGVAIHDEYPDYYNVAAGRYFAEHLPARNFIYDGGMYHQGTPYGNFRFNCDLWPYFIFDRMGYREIYNSSIQKVPYFLIYTRRPDGSIMPLGDTTDSALYPLDTYAKGQNLLFLMSANAFENPYFVAEQHRQYPADKKELALMRFLLADPKIEKGNITSLPLTRYFGSPFGAMVARTGWNSEDKLVDKASNVAMAYMEVGEYNFGNHDHSDSGAFQIFYKGSLAIDTGLYYSSDGYYGSKHHHNYTKASIAHNTILVYDKAETPMLGRVVSDGGQRAVDEINDLNELLNNGHKFADVISRGYGPDPIEPDYSYLKGDITQAYSEKMKEFKRSFAFLNMKDEKLPAVLMVFDKVVSSNVKFPKYWLLHSIEEPQVNGNVTTIKRTERGYNGKLTNYTMLPSEGNAKTEKIGGPGKEFDIFGTNMPASRIGQDVDVKEQGAWRIQISPKKESAEDLFFNVILVNDADKESGIVPVKIENNDVVGAKVSDRAAVFSKNGEISEKSLSITLPDESETKLLVCDLKAGVWEVSSGLLRDRIIVEEAENTLYVTVSAKDVNLKYLGSEQDSIYKTFSDITDHWAKADIEKMAARRIINGVNDNEFSPETNISRAEFIVLVMRALKLDITNKESGLGDVSQSDWFNDVIATAYKMGIIDQNMIGNGKVKPNDPITREEMTSLIINSYAKATGNILKVWSKPSFKDKDQIAPWAVSSVERAVELGVIKGVTEDSFAPKDNATRAQAAVMIKRLLEAVSKCK